MHDLPLTPPHCSHCLTQTKGRREKKKKTTFKQFHTGQDSLKSNDSEQKQRTYWSDISIKVFLLLSLFQHHDVALASSLISKSAAVLQCLEPQIILISTCDYHQPPETIALLPFWDILICCFRTQCYFLFKILQYRLR